MIAELYTDHDPILRIFDRKKMLVDIFCPRVIIDPEKT